GTMSNLIAVGAHCQRGDEIILGKKSHIFSYEGAGVSAYLGVGMNTIPTQSNGNLLISDIKSSIRDDDPHYPRTSLVAVENTHNTCGARLGNASVFLNSPLADLVANVDTISLCLSKGLGAPVGSILAGPEDFISKAKRLRKSLGGGMRQSGILAAAGLYALENNIDRLAEDHENAQILAQGLAKIPGFVVDVPSVESNLVYFSIDNPTITYELFVNRMESKGVLLSGGYGDTHNQLRAATHLDVSKADIEFTLECAKKAMSIDNMIENDESEEIRPQSVQSKAALLASSAMPLVDDTFLETQVDDEEDDPLVLQLYGQNLSSIEEITLGSTFHHLSALYILQNNIGSLDALKFCAKSLSVLNVSTNVLTNLPGHEFWREFHSLKVLDISDNFIPKWKDLEGIEALFNIVLLRVSGNPIASLQNYRSVFVNRIPQLKGLDDHVITDEERIQNANFAPRYNSLHPLMLITEWRKWENKPKVPDFTIISSLNQSLSLIKRQYECNSPVIRLQRQYRGYRCRLNKQGCFKRVRHASIIIQRNYRGWAFRRYLLNQLRLILRAQGRENLFVSTMEKRRQHAIPKIMSIWIERQRDFRRNKAGHRIKQFFITAMKTWRTTKYQLLDNPETLNLVCTQDTLEIVLKAAEIAYDKEIYVLGLPYCAMNSRVIECKSIILQTPSYYFPYQHLKHAMDLTKYKVIYQSSVRCSSIAQQEYDILQADFERVLYLIRQSKENCYQLHSLYSELDHRLKHAKMRLEQERQQEKWRKEDYSPCGLKYPIPIRARGQKKCTSRPAHLLQPKTYERLFVFVPKSIGMFHRTLHLLHSYHTYDAKVFHLIDFYTLTRIAAATRIQCVYSSYKTRQNTCFRQQFMIRRATYCLQRWWRACFYLKRRLMLWTDCLRVAATIDTKVLYVEEAILETLRSSAAMSRIYQTTPHVPGHDWKFKFTPKGLHILITLEESLSRLPDDEKQSYLNTFLVENAQQRAGLPLWMPHSPVHEIVGREEKVATKDQVSLLLSKGVKDSVADDIFPRQQLYTSIDSSFMKFTTSRHIVHDSYVLSDHADSEGVDMTWFKSYGISFIKLEFDSINEARHRAMMLCLKTYDARTKTYARLFTYSMLRYLWLDKPTLSPDELVSDEWLNLRLHLPSTWGSLHTSAKPLQRGHGKSTRLPETQCLLETFEEYEADLDLRSLQFENGQAMSESEFKVKPATIHRDVHPILENYLHKETLAKNVRLDTESAHAIIKTVADEELLEKKLNVAKQHIPHPPPPMVAEVHHLKFHF
ncbi:L-allo-threonine aldolase, partial [Thraustotheca clavata]